MNPAYRDTRSQAAGASPRPSPEQPGMLRGCGTSGGETAPPRGCPAGAAPPPGRIRPRTERGHLWGRFGTRVSLCLLWGRDTPAAVAEQGVTRETEL